MKTGLYFQDPKYDISCSRTITDPNLVLYLPLHRLDGASFMSRDAYGHLCTVTGALWRPNGRYFDGLDDYIYIPDHAAFDITTKITVMAWVKCVDITVAGTDGLVAKSVTAGDQREWSLQRQSASGQLKVTFGDAVLGNYEGRQLTDDPHLVNGAWLLAGFTFDEGTVEIQANGVAVDSSLDAGAIPPTLFNGTADVEIASENVGTGLFNGSIGEVWIYNRVLTLQERQHIYLATKWRYQ